MTIDDDTNHLFTVRSDINAFNLLFSGGIAGLCAKSTVAPIDRIKILYQTNPNRVFSVQKSLKSMVKIYKNTGVQGLFRGNLASVSRVVPFSSVQFYTYHRANELTRTRIESNLLTRFVCGSLAGTIASIVTYPLDLIHGRQAAHWNPTPRYELGVATAFIDIFRSEGFTGLYRGIAPTLQGIIPYAGVGFSVYETTKKLVNRDFSVPESFFIGGFAGVCGQFVAYPLHVVRRRFQVGTVYGPSTVSNLRMIYKQEGLYGGLYKGFVLSLFKGPIMAGIAFTMNDYCRKHLRNAQLQLYSDSTLYKESFSHSHKYAKKPHVEVQLTVLEGFVSGALAGSLAKTLTAPLDRVKIMYQTNSAKAFSFSNAIKAGRNIWMESGILGFWRGNFATCVRVIPFSGTTFMTYDRYQAWLSQHLSPAASRFFGGSCAGMTATLMTYPLDLMRTRMAAHWGAGPRYTGYINAFKTVIQEEGVRALYSGLHASLIGIIPYHGIGFMLIETAKSSYREKYGRDASLPLHFLMSGTSGLIAQIAVYPLETIRRRRQVAPSELGILRQLQEIAATEGIRKGVYKGLSMNFVKSPIAIALSFTTRDFVKRKMIEAKRLAED